MTQLNGNTYRVTPLTPITFKISADTRSFTPYTSEGFCSETKLPF